MSESRSAGETGPLPCRDGESRAGTLSAETEPASGVAGGHPLRILLATARYLPDSGGTEIHTYEVATRLAARGADVTVASTAPRAWRFPRESREEAVRVVRVRVWPPRRDYYFAPALARVTRHERFDIVHCQGYHTFVAPIVMLAALSARIPYVVTLHSGGHTRLLRRLVRPVQAKLLGPLLRRAECLIAVSPFEADLFARRLHVPRSAFVVIPSGVDLPAASSPQSSDERLIVSPGRLEKYKGHHRVIEALPILNRTHPGIRLRIAGSGPYEKALRKLSASLGVAGQVEIAPVPPAQRQEMARLLGCADIVVALSEYESQGLAILEALAAGKPVLTSDNTALAGLEAYANARTLSRGAGAVEVAASIDALLDAPPTDPPPLPTWDDCVSELLELYRKIIAARPA
jgi:glycosyltransferase involved in cell wall biosynthesis